MNLHQATVADWENIPDSERNIWQRLAASTNGAATIGNAVSIFGGLLVVAGLYAVVYHSLITGIVLIICGRLADILDGIAADATGTKSPVGEALDATTDKTVISLVLIVLIGGGYIPALAGSVFALHALYNIGLWLAARSQKIRIHPSMLGKISAALEWLSICLYLLSDALAQTHSNSADILIIAADIAAILFLAPAIYSSYRYTGILRRTN